MNPYIESFLPLFVAMNLPGVLPIFMGLTDGMTEVARRKLVLQASSTAFGVAVLILFAGQVIFQTMGITIDDLRVGGGLILLVLAITDLIFGDFRQRSPDEDDKETSTIGIVPIGIPLTIGPAAITTIIVSQQSFGYVPSLVSLLINLTLITVGFLYGPRLILKLGADTAKAIAKVTSLFLAAIAVAMIRVGIVGML
ncbi:MAG: MarC family protein [Bacteroidetes Order II. Incertae sedis bacterium]|jgi:multiple antibiotic resistance protein|nr:MarC family protein [Bacteroidetes Order II. bacterium]MDG1755251.1 MarC family protein [Rhodothermales bacterium]HAY36784.1 MarC family protein [Bacteroidota bacterium]MBT4052615.1 MarC family protein [Bacteroidetes Order II. bacterium]MBT4603757.1 MarC family protein [Bacteroidetes Order II. bacterium]